MRKSAKKWTTGKAVPWLLGLVAVLTASLWFGEYLLFEGAKGSYSAGRYGQSVEVYSFLLNVTGNADAVLVNRGAALFRRGEFGAAAGDFSRASKSGDPMLTATARYNEGNSLFRQGEALERSQHDKALHLYREAADRFRTALTLFGDDEDSRHNLALAGERYNVLYRQVHSRDKGEERRKADAESAGRSTGEGERKGGQGEETTAEGVKGKEGEGSERGRAGRRGLEGREMSAKEAGALVDAYRNRSVTKIGVPPGKRESRGGPEKDW